MASQREIAKRALWFSRYKRAIMERDDYAQNVGRVCWDTAAHFFNIGKDARKAAQNAAHPYKNEGDKCG